MIRNMIIALFLTIVIEISSSYIIGIRNIKSFLVIILVNIYTNPIVNLIAYFVLLFNNYILYYICVFILEIGAIIIEYIILKKYIKEKISCTKLVVYNNITSFFIGVILVFFKGVFG